MHGKKNKKIQIKSNYIFKEDTPKSPTNKVGRLICLDV